MQRRVASLGPHDVCLPAVAIALRRPGQAEASLEALRVAGREPLPLLEPLLQPAELGDSEGAQNVGEPVVEPRRADLEVAARLDPVVAQATDRVGHLCVVRRHRTALTGGDDLPRVEREAAEAAEAPAGPAGAARA